MSADVVGRVLLVDDDPALLDALSEALSLRMPGVATDVSEGAQAALARLEVAEYDAIISDIKMPGMDGIQLLSRTRELSPYTPVVLITGHGQTDLAIQALRAGAFDLIQKPLDRDYFVAALLRALEVKRLKREVQAQQAALLEHADTLERKVQERTADLEQALRAKDEFLSLVSHELRNPMTVIMGNAEALHRHGDSLPLEDRKAALTDLRHGTKRLMQLIENLLVMAKAEYGIQETEPVLLDKLIDAEASWHRQFSSTRVVNVQVEVATAATVCNPTHVGLVLRNLIGNADKYSPPAEAIDVFLTRQGEEFVISVCDRGRGIPSGEQELVFQPFYRSRTTADVNGMGIGLAVCRKLVALNQGRIWLSDRPGGGSEFSFSLPAALTVMNVESDTPELVGQSALSAP
jgi:two-component system sensor histidine kinase/response regulator